MAECEREKREWRWRRIMENYKQMQQTWMWKRGKGNDGMKWLNERKTSEVLDDSKCGKCEKFNLQNFSILIGVMC
jgi:hypothetical protein